MKRITKIIIVTPLLVVVALIAAFLLWLFVINPVIWQRNTNEESIRILASAKSTDELAAAVGSLGLLLTFPDGSWMAIRYVDTHAGGCSLAVVRDSGGQWFTSRHHFCGELGTYHQQYDYQEMMREHGGVEHDELQKYPIHVVAISQSLDTARDQLLKIGFTTMKR